MPLIPPSKVFNFHLLCQLTRAQAPNTWAPASVPEPVECPWTLNAWQGRCPAEHGVKPLQKPHLREATAEEGKARGSGTGGKRRLKCESGGVERGKSELEKTQRI